MTLGLAIPYHSHPELLKKTLDSVLRQTSSDWECTVYDDSRDEKCKILVEGFGHPKIKYILNPNSTGMVSNWNYSLQNTKQPLVTLLHADDELAPGYVKLMLELHSKYPGAFAYFCRAEIIGKESKLVFSFPDFSKDWLIPAGDIVEIKNETGAFGLLRGNFIMCPTLCFQKKFLDQAGYFCAEYKMVQDLDWILNALLKGGVLVGSKARCYRYRRHAENTTTALTDNLMRFEEEVLLYQKYKVLFGKKGWTVASEKAGEMTIIKLHLFYQAVTHLIKGKWGQVKRIFGFYRKWF